MRTYINDPQHGVHKEVSRHTRIYFPYARVRSTNRACNITLTDAHACWPKLGHACKQAASFSKSCYCVLRLDCPIRFFSLYLIGLGSVIDHRMVCDERLGLFSTHSNKREYSFFLIENQPNLMLAFSNGIVQEKVGKYQLDTYVGVDLGRMTVLHCTPEAHLMCIQ